MLNETRLQLLLSFGLTTLSILLWFITKMWLVPLVLVILPLLLIFILRIPFYVVITFVIFSYFRIHEAFPVLMPFRIPLLFSLASFFVLIWHIYFSRKLKLYWTAEMTVLCLFLGWAAIGVFFANNSKIS